MAGTGIMAGIFTSTYPTEKVGDSPYPYPYLVNAGIPRQNGDGFGQYPRGRVRTIPTGTDLFAISIKDTSF